MTKRVDRNETPKGLELFRRLRLRIAGRLITIHWPFYRSVDPTIARHIVPVVMYRCTRH